MMKCPRCEGLMMEAHFFDFEGTDGFFWMKGWQCVNCGYAVDPLMEANRQVIQSQLPLVAADKPVTSVSLPEDYAKPEKEAA